MNNNKINKKDDFYNVNNNINVELVRTKQEIQCQIALCPIKKNKKFCTCENCNGAFYKELLLISFEAKGEICPGCDANWTNWKTYKNE